MTALCRLRHYGATVLRSRCWRGFAAAASGSSAVEFAFILPITVYLFIGVVDYGVGLYRKMEVKQAAQVGAEYAVINGFDASAISQAVTSATVFPGISASPAPSTFCGCASTTGVVQATCGSTCSDGKSAGTYLTVSASGQYSTVLPYPLVPNAFPLNGKATVRMQ
jgi:Flp pilus assembly protein TadG